MLLLAIKAALVLVLAAAVPDAVLLPVLVVEETLAELLVVEVGLDAVVAGPGAAEVEAPVELAVPAIWAWMAGLNEPDIPDKLRKI